MYRILSRFPSGSRLVAAVSVAVLAAAAGCDGSGTEPELETDIQEIVASLSSGTATASLQAGAPASDAGAPAVSVTGFNTVIPGGGARFTVSATEDFSVVYVFVDGREGYYQLNLGSARSSADLILTLGEALDLAAYQLRFAVGTGSGAGDRATQEIEVVDVGSGDVQVSVAWDVPSDVDLYVVEPSGETIYYGNSASNTGGELNLDSNAACGGRDVRNENITWPEASPPRGEYTVRVNYWSACGEPATNYVVTVRVAGQQTRTFEGRFTGSGNGGGESAGDVITIFTY